MMKSDWMPQLALWIALAAVFALLPKIFPSGGAISTLCMMGVMIVFALSYNLLLGQSGMLSFGHAAYYGLAGFFSVHAYNMIVAAKLPIPLPFLPLVGGAFGLLFGAIFGSFSTRRSGTAFAMISLGIVELVVALSLVMNGFFGGESGVSMNRVKGFRLLGLSFGPQIQVYYLIAVWCFVVILVMYGLTRTPLGRMCNAVRENPDRVAFLGYSTWSIRFRAFCLSGFFAGIAGALAAINFEIVGNNALGATQSGMVLLMAYIGGVGHFFGPIIGAVLITLLQTSLSDFTGAWQLYLGILFICVVMFVPGGLAGLISMHLLPLRAGLLHRLIPSYLAALPPLLCGVLGISLAIELTFRLTVEAQAGSRLRFFGVPADAASPWSWAAVIVLMLVAIVGLRRFGPRSAAAYERVIGEAREKVSA